MKATILRACLIPLLFTGFLYAQRTVTGTVQDEFRNPFFGVTIQLKGTKSGAVTNAQGQYALMIPNDKVVLAFTFPGYVTQEITVGSRSVLDLQMLTELPTAEYQLTTALGTGRRPDRMATAFSSIAPEALLSSGESPLLNALSGKAAAVRVARTNGEPGAGTNLSIRGASTLTGSSDVLVLVDGVPVITSTLYDGGNGGRLSGIAQQSRLNDLNPMDIRSVDVLKGPAAVSLWGSRAANGIIAITTHSGKAGKPEIIFRTSLSLDAVSTRHDLQQAYGQGQNGVFDPNSRYSWGDLIAERSGAADQVNTSADYFTGESGTAYYPLIRKTDRQTYRNANYDQVFRQGHTSQSDLSIKGGSESSRFYFGLGYLDQQGVIQNSDYSHIHLRINNDTELTPWLSISTRTAYTHSDANRVQQGANAAGLLLGLLNTAPDFDISDYRGTYFSVQGEELTLRHRSYRNPLAGPDSDPIYGNPLWTIREQKNTSTLNRYLLSSALHIDPSRWLRLTLRGGLDAYQDRRIYFFPVGSPGPERAAGIFNESQIAEGEFTLDAFATGKFRLDEALGLETTLGWNLNDRRRRLNYTEIRAFEANVDLQTTDLNTSDDKSSVSQFKRYIRSNRLYGLFSFDLLSRFFLDLSATQEAASTFSGTAFYPAAALSWHFVRPGSGFLFSFGKARISWGKTGIQPEAHRFETLAESGFTYSTLGDGLSISEFGGGFRIDETPGNPVLRPETKTELELGADLRLFNDRLGVSATYYRNEIRDLLFPVSLPPSSGYLYEYVNGGAMENEGLEAQLDYTFLKLGNFTLNTYANLHLNRNVVTDLNGMNSFDLTPGSTLSSRAVVGYPLGVLWSTRALRAADGTMDLDENGFPQLDPDEGIIGDPNPAWRGGFGLRAGLKNLKVNVLIEHSQGGQFAEYTRYLLRNAGTHADVGHEITLDQALSNVQGVLVPAGTTVRGNIEDFGAGPVLLDEAWYTSRGAGPGSEAIREFAMTDATWTRLREVSVSYTFGGEWLRRWQLASLNLAATGRNLFLLTQAEGADPEINQFGTGNSFGLDYYTHPVTRSWLLSLTLTY